MLQRRSLIGALLAAPALIRSSIIMPISVTEWKNVLTVYGFIIDDRTNIVYKITEPITGANRITVQSSKEYYATLSQLFDDTRSS